MFTASERGQRHASGVCVVMLGDQEQLPVASVCCGADHNLDVGGTVVISIMHFLNGGFLIQPPTHKHTHTHTLMFVCVYTHHLDVIKGIDGLSTA